MISGPGRGRDATLRTIRRSGILLSFLRDVTPDHPVCFDLHQPKLSG
jgi:ribosomal protein S11